MRRLVLAAVVALLPGLASAAEPHRSWYQLPSSNGWGAVVVDLQEARATHWRDHLFATEEPRWDVDGAEVWLDDVPQSVFSRDLLFDAYFGLRANGQQQWLTDLPVDLDDSGWETPGTGAPDGGSGVVVMQQTWGDLVVTTRTFAPWSVGRSSMVMLLSVYNGGTSTVDDLSAFSVHNLHLGEGRPGPTEEIGVANETVVVHAAGAVEERGFAGVTALLALRPADVTSAWWPGAGHANPFEVVAGTTDDVPAVDGDQGSHTDAVSYLQWDEGELTPGETAWFGFVVAHYGDPFSYTGLAGELTTWAAGRSPEAVHADELAEWADFGSTVVVPEGLSADEASLYGHAAVVLRMAQVREVRAYLREWLSADGEARYSAFGGELPADVEHSASGAVLASLPPGQWTYAWPRDGAYAVVGMALAGMHAEARDALEFLLTAESGRYVGYDELAGVPLGDYQVSLTRHHGFGIEESDTLAGGDFNFEFDGAGLTLWALREYVRASEDWTIVDDHWDTLSTEVAGWLLPLIEESGLIEADSGIWEVHWLGKERRWSYTSASAMRGLCDAAELADYMGEAALAESWREAAETLRGGLLDSLRDGELAVASNREELELGSGYADAAAIEVVGFGVIDPLGETAGATLDLLDDQLMTPDGPGYSRNDDAWDLHDLSPWGSGYDEAEWVFIDLRAATSMRAAGRTAEADVLLQWVLDQSTANYLAIGETYDRVTADYTNNAPMVGFGSGAWIVAMNQRAGAYEIGAACGEFADESVAGDDDDDTTDDDDATDDDDDVTDDDDTTDDDDVTDDDDDSRFGGCGCTSELASAGRGGSLAVLLAAALRRRRSGARAGAAEL